MFRYFFALWLFLLLLPPTKTFSFSFSEHEKQEQQAEQYQQQAEQDRIAELLATPCGRRLKNSTVAFVLLQEHQQGFMIRHGSEDQAIYDVINGQLSRLGLHTLSPQQITARIAAAETEAFLANDMDAAASAAQRLQARFFIKGQIITKHSLNKVLGIDELSLTLLLSLSNAQGRTISNIQVSDTVFADSNVTAGLLKLVEEQGEKAVARLYRDFCEQEK